MAETNAAMHMTIAGGRTKGTNDFSSANMAAMT